MITSYSGNIRRRWGKVIKRPTLRTVTENEKVEKRVRIALEGVKELCTTKM